MSLSCQNRGAVHGHASVTRPPPTFSRPRLPCEASVARRGCFVQTIATHLAGTASSKSSTEKQADDKDSSWDVPATAPARCGQDVKEGANAPTFNWPYRRVPEGWLLSISLADDANINDPRAHEELSRSVKCAVYPGIASRKLRQKVSQSICRVLSAFSMSPWISPYRLAMFCPFGASQNAQVSLQSDFHHQPTHHHPGYISLQIVASRPEDSSVPPCCVSW